MASVGAGAGGTAEWTYYAVFVPPRTTPTAPLTLLRHRRDTPVESAETLRSSGEWGPSPTLLDVRHGRGDRRVAPLDRDRAAAVADEWVRTGQRLAVPDDLRLPPTGEPGERP